ncbi:MAG: hypothetical protein ACM3UN_02445 [Bacillota bacterium]
MKNKHLKDQPKQVNLLKSKYYWITLTAIILAFSVVIGFLMQIPLGKELLILCCILSVLGLAFYVGFKSSEGYNKRATFFFVGASIVGFSIWAVIFLSLNATGVTQQISSLVDIDLFAITSLIICLVLGAIIGDLIGKNRETIGLNAGKLRKRLH